MKLSSAARMTGVVAAPRTPVGQARAGAAEYDFSSLVVPERLGRFAFASGVNNAGVIVGHYTAPDRAAEGFIYHFGHFQRLTIAGAHPTNRGGVLGVNGHGISVGTYGAAESGDPRSFIRFPSGRIEPLPNAARETTGTEALAINNWNVVVGSYFDASEVEHGFVFHAGKYSVFDYPGARGTALTSIDDGGRVIGSYVDADSRRHGFMVNRGVLHTLDVPGARSTAPAGINNRGQIVGAFRDAASVLHGFVYARGEFTTLDYPGATDTLLTAINDAGVIVGSYDFSAALKAEPRR